MKEKIREILLKTHSIVHEIIVEELNQLFYTELTEAETNSYQSGYDDGYSTGYADGEQF